MNSVPVAIERIKAGNANQLAAVIAIGDRYKKTLGLLPADAYAEYARNGTLLIAKLGKTVIGYALYSVSKNRARLVHLAVLEEHRGMNASGLLLDRLKEETTHLDYILLRCRQDYNLGGLWKRNSFDVRGSHAGRNHQGHELVTWIYRHTSLPLLQWIQDLERDGESSSLLIDTNIFLDIIKPQRPFHGESIILRDGPYSGELVLFISSQVLSDVHGNSDIRSREEETKALQTFRELATDPNEVRRISAELTGLWPPNNQNDRSDLVHLAHAISGSVDYFVTRDQRVLDRVDELMDRYGLSVRRPSDLMLHYDSEERTSLYLPERAKSSSWSMRRPSADDLQGLVDGFVESSRGEKNTLWKELCGCLPQTHSIVT